MIDSDELRIYESVTTFPRQLLGRRLRNGVQALFLSHQSITSCLEQICIRCT